MRTYAILLLLLAAACTEEKRAIVDGAELDVLFDERHGLQGGEPVRFQDFDIGEIATVDVHAARVRARLSVEREVLAQLTAATTFTVEEDGGGLFLDAHVLDLDAAKLEPGMTLEGSDSAVELALKKAGASATKLFKLNPEKERELERRVDEAREKLNELAEESSETAKDAAVELERGMERLSEELEKAGKSEEAGRLREKLKELLEKIKVDPNPSP